MTVKDFSIGDRFVLRSKGHEKSRYEVAGIEDGYLRVIDSNAPDLSPMWIWQFQLDQYAEKGNLLELAQ
jgi:hypothetical protein